jgi:hypothetical protein
VLNYAAGQENSLKWQQLKELTQKHAAKVININYFDNTINPKE